MEASSSVRRRASWAGTLGLGVAALAGAIAVIGAGHGYPVQDVRLLSGSAWLASSQAGQVTLLDGASAEVAAQVQAAPAGHALDVVQQGSTAYAIDRTAGTLRRIDGATFGMSAVATPVPGAQSGLTAFADSHHVYAMDAQRGLLTSADPRTLAPEGPPISLAAQVSAGSTVLDDAGRLWLIDNGTGDLTEVSGGKRTVHRDAARPGHDVLTLVNGEPVIVDTAERKAISVDADSGTPGSALDLDLRPSDTIAVSGSPHAHRLYVVMSRGLLDICDTTARTCGTAVPLDTAGNDLGPAVEAGDRLFVPDYTTGQVWLIDLGRQTVVATAQVLTPAARFQLLTRDGVVFFNDPDSERAGVISLDGAVRQVAKYDPADPSKGLVGNKPPTAPSTKPSSAPSSPQTSASASAPTSTRASTSPSTPASTPVSAPPSTPAATPTPPRPTTVPTAPPTTPPVTVPHPTTTPAPSPTTSEPVSLKITLSKTSAMVGEAVTFQVTNASGPQPTAVHWTFGDGAHFDGVSASHAWTAPGTYAITATATMPGGSVQAPLSVSLTVTAVPISYSVQANAAPSASYLCGFSRPTITATGTISATPQTSLQYEWIRSDGSVAGPFPLTAAPTGTSVAPDSWMPPADSGSDTLRVLPAGTAQKKAPFSLTCTAPLHATVHTVSATVSLNPGQGIGARVPCPAGEQVVGGGFSSGFPDAAVVIGTGPPVDDSYWFAEFDNPSTSPITFVAYANCLSTSVNLGLHHVVAQANPAPNTSATVVAACPAGETLVGGGFDSVALTVTAAGVPHFYASYPNGDSWTVQVTVGSSGGPVSAYAMCAANHVAVVVDKTVTSRVAGQTSITTGTCPAGAVVSEGGFRSDADGSSINTFGSDSGDQPSLDYWMFSGLYRSGPVPNVTVYARCIALS